MQRDPRDAELVETAASVVGRLIIAVDRVDHPAIMGEVTRLLNAVVQYTAAMRKRPDDAVLARAVELAER